LDIRSPPRFLHKTQMKDCHRIIDRFLAILAYYG